MAQCYFCSDARNHLKPLALTRNIYVCERCATAQKVETLAVDGDDLFAENEATPTLELDENAFLGSNPMSGRGELSSQNRVHGPAKTQLPTRSRIYSDPDGRYMCTCGWMDLGPLMAPDYDNGTRHFRTKPCRSR